MPRNLKISFIFFILTMLVLTACTFTQNPSEPPPVSDDEMATRVAQILTDMPAPTSALPTDELPPLPTATPVAEDKEVPEATQTPIEAATNVSPTEETTQAPTEPQPTATEAAATATPTLTEVPVTATPGLTLVPSFTPPPSDPRSKLGTADWTDNMDDGTGWPTGENTYTNIDFKDGKLYLTGNTTTDGWRLATTPKLNNFYIEMKVSTGTCSGDDRYGIMFRVPVAREANRGYLYGVTCDGKYSLREWDETVGDKGQMTNHVYWTANSAIQTGSNKTNTLGIMAVGDRLILYVNGVLLTEVKDATFTEGSFGIFVGARQTDQFTIGVDEMNYWKNPTP
jgi:hypothetical protein